LVFSLYSTVEQDDVVANDQDKIDELKVEINDLWEELDFANHKLDLADESHAELSKELKDQEGAEELLVYKYEIALTSAMEEKKILEERLETTEWSMEKDLK